MSNDVVCHEDAPCGVLKTKFVL